LFDMKKISAFGAVAFAALVGSTAVHAQGAYVGGALGKTQFALQDCDADCTRRVTGGKVFGGYRFANGWALEGTYFRFGKVKENVVVGTVGWTASLEGETLGFGGAYTFFGLDNSPINATVRAGLGVNRVTYGASTAGFSGSESETKVRPYFGVGVGYAVTKNVNIDLSVDFTRFSSDDLDATARARMLSLGATYAF
jgi:OOP family OmpA-OmpF porin